MKIINLTTLSKQDKLRVYKTWLIFKERCVPYFDNDQVQQFIGLLYKITVMEVRKIIKDFGY